MKFLLLFSGLIGIFFTALQVAVAGLVIWAAYFIYTSGLESLINGIWKGFGQ